MKSRGMVVSIKRIRTLAAALVMLPAAGLLANDAARAEDVDFTTQIRPILSGKCFKCHGPDESSRKAKLRLDLRDEAMKDRNGTRAITPGEPGKSEVIARIRATDPDDIMPPPDEGNPLTENDIVLLERWIKEGAEFSAHWSFTRPERPRFPSVQTPAWCKNPIDFFTLEKLESHGLKPSPEADRHALIRRLSLDITGLPPSPAETDAFIADTQSDAYERLVDRLLSSPAYGERWARIWLDLARYADSAGYGSDPLRPNIWPWRDWVIQALNRNMRYDQFTIEQLAGDLLQDPTQDQLIATAFHRNTMTNTEGGTDDEEFRVAAVKDRANTTAQVWMGLTMGCAQCHSHKYDPISQGEYYQFYSFFNQTEDTDKPDERPTLPLPTRDERRQMDELQSKIEALEIRRNTVTPEFQTDVEAWEKNQIEGVNWRPLDPSEVKSYGGATLSTLPDKSILATGLSPETDAYAVRVQSAPTDVTAIRLELLPHESLPANGPGRAIKTGRSVVNEFSLAVRPPEEPLPLARYVRVELTGSQRILSLAEVEVFSNGKNHARSGTAKQPSTAEGADAGRAIDGTQNGDFSEGSVTMTRSQDDPWWELDLGKDTPLDEIVLWNRTDRGLGTRLANFKIRALDSERNKVWEKEVSSPPAPMTFFRIPGEQAIKFKNASADFHEKDFNVAEATDGNNGPNSGWSIGDETGVQHAASFEIGASKPFEKPGALLVFALFQTRGTNHTVGRFRISATTDPLPVRIPPKRIKKILEIAATDRSQEQIDELNTFVRDFAPSLASVNEDLKKLKRELDRIKPVAVPIMRELEPDDARETHILAKGNFLNPGDEVEPAVPAAFHPLPDGAPANRLGVADWLVDPRNPLTARVAVNRLWARFFGVGIVETEEDFGTQGSFPTHRKLLDWLAVEFTDNEWDLKAIIKTIVLSATYRQSSRTTPEALEKDPLNRLFARGARLRLDAETIRDQALALGGLLSRQIGGPSVYPVQPGGLWRAAFNGQRTWATSKGEDRYRRGLYTFWRRTVPYPSMATFDAPSRENCTVRRIPTNTPLQAFVTLNDPVFFEAAQALARRIIYEGGETPAERGRYGLRLCLSRPPTGEQITPIVTLYDDEVRYYREHLDDAKTLATDPLGPLPDGLDPAEAAAWTVAANVLLNLDGVLTKN